MAEHKAEVREGRRFEFGRNWARFLATLDEKRIDTAKKTLQAMLAVETLAGRTFLDAGSGSGLFSLAARMLGAKVRSFDYDGESVACTAELKRRYFPDDADWLVEEASVLDKEYLKSLGQFDVVYSWGVLHHTGAMWEALENVSGLVRPGGQLFISIYNDQGRASRVWRAVKRAYNRLPRGLKWIVLWPAFARLWGPTIVRDTFKGRPLATWSGYGGGRGMSPWRDVVDWVGGYPFEVARPESILEFYRERGYVPERLTTCGTGHGCNEFVFRKA